ncbi:MAG: NUDIX hydrolase [Oligoflexales bacterium]
MIDFIRQYADFRSVDVLDAHDEDMTSRFTDLFASTSRPFLRSTYPGHVTASALVIAPQLNAALFTFHKKAKKWLQLGGHADEHETSPAQTALREAQEESGLRHLKTFSWQGQITPIDLDIHAIPGWAGEPPHNHYDVRYLLATDRPDDIQISDESDYLRWFTFAEARKQIDEISILRLLDKAERILNLPQIEDSFIP